MGKNSLNGLLDCVKNESKDKYPKLINLVDYLKTERIKFVGNDLRGALDIPSKSIDKDSITNAVLCINDIAKSVNYDFSISDEWENIEKYLRYTILEDLEEEFEKQGKWFSPLFYICINNLRNS